MKKIFLISFLTFLLLPSSAWAQVNPENFNSIYTAYSTEQCGRVEWIEQSTGISNGLIIPCSCLDSSPETPCGLNQVLQTIVNVSKIILAVTGAAAILMFSYGGVMFIIAAGNTERIQQGKDAIRAAGIGIVIVLTAWIIVNFTISAITKGEVTGGGIFGQPWERGPSTNPESSQSQQQELTPEEIE